MKCWKTTLWMAFCVALAGCSSEAPEPTAEDIDPERVSLEATEGYLPVLLDKREFAVDDQINKYWTVTVRQQFNNVQVHDSTKHDDGTYTMWVSFEAIDRDNEVGIAAEAKIKYEVNETPIIGLPGKKDAPQTVQMSAGYKVLDVEPISVKQVGEWETQPAALE